jgi:hypothetical protein
LAGSARRQQWVSRLKYVLFHLTHNSPDEWDLTTPTTTTNPFPLQKKFLIRKTCSFWTKLMLTDACNFLHATSASFSLFSLSLSLSLPDILYRNSGG